MEKFVIEGGRPLNGVVVPSGNKNGALALLAATLLTDQKIVLENVPRIKDVKTMVAIIADIGVDIEWSGDHEETVQAKNLTATQLDGNLCREIRASMLLAGPMLARCGRIYLPLPGGDVIGRRRVDTHLAGLRALGAEIEVDSGYKMQVDKLRGQDIFLDEASVTGTENIIMAACFAEGTTIIRNAACEPHVQGLAHFLNSVGAQISGIGSNTLTIQGVRTLRGGACRIAP